MAKRGRPPMIRDRYPNRIQATREALGISRRALAKARGVDTDTIRRYEIGERELKVRELERIACILGVPAGDLLNSTSPIAAIAERAMLAIFRELAPGDRDRLLRMARALVTKESKAAS